MPKDILTKCFILVTALALIMVVMPGTLFSQEISPEKPDIFLPSVVLEVEDLSVKNIVAPLPEEELLAPDINFPLPDKEDLEIKENVVNIEPVPSGIESSVSTKGGKLRTNTTLGLGTLNNFYSYISLYSFATTPEAKLIYEHETADGFSGKPSSIGYNIRTDNVSAGLNYKKDKLSIDANSSFNEIERGLQEKSSYYSKINRFITFNTELSYLINDNFEVFGELDNSFVSQRLTGGNASYKGEMEYYISPKFKAEYQFKKGIIGLKGYFGYRGVGENKSLSLSRFLIGGYVNYDISEKNSIKAGINGSWNSKGSSYVPFYLGAQSNVNDYLSISAEGGYRLTLNNLYDIFTDFPYVDIPNTLSDTTDWYLNGGIMWIASEKWVFTSKIEYSKFFNKPGFASTLDSNGLFNIDEYSGEMLESNIGARWIISESFTSRFKIKSILGNIPENMNRLEAEVNLDAISKKGNFGGGAELGYFINKINPDQIPLLNINSFYRINDYFNFSLEIQDILQLVADKKRYSYYPYLDRGFFITIKTSVNF